MWGGVIARLVVLPAQLLSTLAGLCLMSAPFLLAWQALAKWRNGAWPHASVGDALAFAHVRPGGPTLLLHAPLWLALAAVGLAGLYLSTALAKLLLGLAQRAADRR